MNDDKSSAHKLRINVSFTFVSFFFFLFFLQFLARSKKQRRWRRECAHTLNACSRSSTSFATMHFMTFYCCHRSIFCFPFLARSFCSGFSLFFVYFSFKFCCFVLLLCLSLFSLIIFLLRISVLTYVWKFASHHGFLVSSRIFCIELKPKE